MFLRDQGLITFFTFLQYSYREEAVWFIYRNLLIRLNPKGLIEYILAPKKSILSSTYI